MNAQITSQPSLPSREVKFKIGPALAAASCCATLAFLAMQFVGFAMGIESGVRTVAGIHVALAVGIVAGFSTLLFAMDDKEDKEVMVLTIEKSRPTDDPRPVSRRAA